MASEAESPVFQGTLRLSESQILNNNPIPLLLFGLNLTKIIALRMSQSPLRGTLLGKTAFSGLL
jgi:hypothetical protein